MSSKTDGLRRSDVLAIGALVCLGAILRIYRLDAGLWYDEIVTLVESVRPTFLRIVTAYPGYNNHPLYSALAHLSVSTLGEHAWTVRVPAVVFGVAAIPMLYILCASIATRREAFLAASLLTVSYHHIWFSQDARGYTALLFWTMLVTWLFVRLTEEARATLIIAYGVGMALGLYTHLTMAFVMIAHAITWAVWIRSTSDVEDRSRRLKTAVWAIGIAGIVSAALYSPLFGQVYAHYRARPPSMSASAVKAPGWAVLEVVKGLRLGLGIVGVIMAGALAAFGLRSYRRQNVLLTMTLVAPGVIGASALLLIHSPLRPRFFFNLLGFATLFVVRGALDVGRWICGTRWQWIGGSDAVGGAIVGVIIVASVASLPDGYRYPKQDFDGAMRFVNAHRADMEPVATAGVASYPLTRYYGLPWTPVHRAHDLEPLRSVGRRVWLVYSLPEYIAPDLIQTIRDECVPLQTLHGTLGGGDVIVCAFDSPTRE